MGQRILEVLSDGKPRTYADLQRLVAPRADSYERSRFPAAHRALASSGRIARVDGGWALAGAVPQIARRAKLSKLEKLRRENDRIAAISAQRREVETAAHHAPVLERLVSQRAWGGIAPHPSPLQVAIARAACGLEPGLDADTRRRHLGAYEPGDPPRVVWICAGVRGGKSHLAARAAIAMALTADLERTSSADEIWCPVVAPTRELARATYSIVRGVCESEELRERVVGDPLAAKITLRRDDGRDVSVVVVAAAESGRSVRARWLAGLVLDECAYLAPAETGYAVTAEGIVQAARPRLLPRTQIWAISSPAGREGLLYQAWRAHREGDDPPRDELFVHAPTLALNPTYPATEIEAIRRRDPDTAAREYDAEWGETLDAWIPRSGIEACERADSGEGPVAGWKYVAASDPGTRANAWTLVVAAKDPQGRTRVVLAREWIGTRGAPLSPDGVLEEMAAVLGRYCVREVLTDQYAYDALRDLAGRRGLVLVERAWGRDAHEVYAQLRYAVVDGTLSLPRVEHLVSDLAGVRRRVGHLGPRVELQRTPDGRHCDYAPAVALAHGELRYAEAPTAASEIEPTWGEAYQARLVDELSREWWDSGPDDGEWLDEVPRA